MNLRSARAILASTCVLFALVQIAAFRWGVITPDSVVQYGQALSGQYDDWHPPITAWLWRQLLRFGTGGAPFLLLDVALYWGAIGLIADRIAVRHGVCWAAAPMLIGMLPIPFGQIGAILKDPLMACLLLMAVALLVRGEEARGWLRRFALPLILVAAATRINAPFAALPLLLLWLPQGWTMSPGRIVASASIAIAALLASGWTINQAMLRPHHSQPIFSLINFDLAGIIAQGGPNLYPTLGTAEARAFTAACYEPKLYGARDADHCAFPEDSLAAYAARSGASPVGLWLSAILAAPGPYLRHRLEHVDLNWRLAVAGVPDDAVYMMSEPNPFGLRFTPNALTHAVVGAARAMAWSPLGRPATWLAVALGLLIAAPRLKSRPLVTALAASALLYGGAYAVVSVSTDLRYNLWTMLAAMLGLAFALVEGAQLSRRRMVAASAPLLLVVMLEVGGLLAG